jgi:polysaccharide biosynthesis protein PslH
MLWVTEEVPDRDGGGGCVRQANLLVELATQLDISLLVAGKVTDPLVRAAVREVVEAPAAVAPAGRVPPRLRVAWDLWVRRRGLTVAGSMPAMRALAPELVARHRDHDLVVLNHEDLFPMLPLLSTPREALVVAHLFDVKSVRSHQTAAVATSRRQAWMWGADARAMRRLETEALAVVDLVITCSAEDAATLQQLRPSADTRVVPNGVDLDRFTHTAAPGTARVLFFGSLDYEPNVDGLRWLATDIWPRVRSEVPEATLSVVGHRPGPEVRALAALPGVDVVADVPEAPSWFAGSDVVVVPLRIGTGTRLKALEAMASGRPLVGTTVGLEGLGLAALGDPPPALVADDAAGLAAAVVSLLRDPGAAQRHGAAGRRHVEEHFGWRPIASAMARVLIERLTPAGSDR